MPELNSDVEKAVLSPQLPDGGVGKVPTHQEGAQHKGLSKDFTIRKHWVCHFQLYDSGQVI